MAPLPPVSHCSHLLPIMYVCIMYRCMWCQTCLTVIGSLYVCWRQSDGFSLLSGDGTRRAPCVHVLDCTACRHSYHVGTCSTYQEHRSACVGTKCGQSYACQGGCMCAIGDGATKPVYVCDRATKPVHVCDGATNSVYVCDGATRPADVSNPSVHAAQFGGCFPRRRARRVHVGDRVCCLPKGLG